MNTRNVVERAVVVPVQGGEEVKGFGDMEVQS